MILHLLFATVLTFPGYGGGTAAAAAPTGGHPDLLLYWTFDEGAGNTTQDLSGNGLDGKVTARWTDSPAGKAVAMDGTPKGIVSVRVPEPLRFGKGSWTFMAAVKPKKLSIDDRQNQRRLFAFGKYPDAYLVLDISGKGRPMCYFCYQNAAGKTVAVGGSAEVPLVVNRWAHVALVCDRDNRRIHLYVNGYTTGPIAIREDFAGNYVLDGLLTVGNPWHNYWGAVDEVKVYRRALSPKEIEQEFERLKPTFHIVESEEARAAKERFQREQTFRQVTDAWKKRDFNRVRRLCQEVAKAEHAPPHFRSYARLRIAQSYLAEGNRAAAKAAYEAIAAEQSYPAVHRYEARESIRELDRLQQGLPARDPSASRTEPPVLTKFAAEVFVAPKGDDAHDGSEQHPFATLTRARDEVRALRKRGLRGPLAVTVLPGRYSVPRTLSLTAEDSGTPDGPVVYRARKRGTALFFGGVRLHGFKPVTDEALLKRLPPESRGKVYQCDLKALGITDYGELKVRGFGQPPSPPTVELYFNGKPMTLARWPNKGFVGIRKLINPGSKAKGEPSVFEYDSDRPERWLHATDGWLFGYFHFLWADATAKIGNIDPTAHTLTTAEPYDYGGRGMSTIQGIQYYAFNLLEEIDMPGEWYLERTTGMLYLYPPADPDAATIEMGMFSRPMVTLAGVHDVWFDGLVFDLGRYNGIVATNCTDCLFVGCTVSRFAGNGVMIHGGKHDTLLGCTIGWIGRRATEIIGGDRASLTPGRHVVENCILHDFGRIDRTYTPAIQLEGVGNRVAHNLMYNGPSSAMRIEGNDHLIEFNEVYNMVQESDDQGAMELFRNATYRGVVFRYNYLHDIGKAGGKTVHGQAALRFDDAISGMVVYGNVFRRAANGRFGAVQMNSGRDNLIDNNLFLDCKQGISGGWNPANSVWRMLRAGKKPPDFFTTPLYLKRYPKLATMLEDPGINHVWRNVFYRCGAVATSTHHLDLFENGVFPRQDPGFVDAPHGDFRLRRDAPLFAVVGFKPIPFDEIGPYPSPLRASGNTESPVQR